MATELMSLPTELLAIVLSQLSLQSLLAFAATSRINQELAGTMLQELNLAVFPRELHGRLALMEHNEETTTLNFSVIKTTTHDKPLDICPSNILKRQISAQNKAVYSVLNNQFTHSLKSLSLHMYDFSSHELASLMASNLTMLRELTLKFCHPYIRDRSFSPVYWREAPNGNSCWNALAGLGTENQSTLRLRNLRILHIERAGLTSVQLRRFVETNWCLKELYLDNVIGVDQEFVQWLGAYCESGQSKLEKITFQNCPQLRMQNLEDFAWLAGISGTSVRHLSLFKCRNVQHKMLVSLIDDEDEELALNMLETVVPPRGPPRHYGVAEEVSDQSLTVLASGSGEVAKHFVDMAKIDVDPEFMVPGALPMA